MEKFLLIFLLFFLTACNSVTKNEPPFVSYKKAETQSFEKNRIFQGFIDRRYDTILSFKVPGIVKNIYVYEGDYVKKGTLLARLDNDEYNLDIEKSKSELDDAYIKYNRAKSYYERITKLYNAGGISYNDWENAEVDLKSNQNRIKILNDSLKIAYDKQRFTNIFAPFDGYIIKSYIDQANYVNSGERVFLFQGKGGLEAKVFVPQSYINNISVGDKVTIFADFMSEKLIGVVKSKVNSSIEDGTFKITISINPDVPNLLDGMSVSVSIFENLQSGIFIPKSSVLADIDGKYVFILNKTSNQKGKVEKRQIETGDSFQDTVFIKNGLNTGELYVTDGVNKISDGIEVEF